MNPCYVKCCALYCDQRHQREGLVLFPKVVFWVALGDVDGECFLLLMQEGAEVQATCVLEDQVQYKDIVLEHDFAVMENTLHNVLLGNDFGENARFLMDQQGPEVYLNLELEVAGLATFKSVSWPRGR